MQVKLKATTIPCDEELQGTAEGFIAYCARVSNPGNQYNMATGPKLLKYLIKNKHWSPFEMAHAVIEIHTTRDISRQLLRHRSFSFQEYSQRYAGPFASVYREARLQDSKNRQNSIEVDDAALKELWENYQALVAQISTEAYNWAIEAGIAKEQARVVLPEGLTTTVVLMSGTIRSWIHFVDVRSKWDTQKEHREIAVECGKIISEITGYEFDDNTG